MSNQVDFLPFAIGNGANVSSQSDYAALAAILTGFQSGPAKSAQVNKAIRQGTVMAAVLANFIANNANVNVLDNGDTATLLTNLVAALKAANVSAGFLNKSNNLSDVLSAATALANLGGLAKSNNLSDIASAVTALTNLGGLAINNNFSEIAAKGAATVATALANLNGLNKNNNLSDLASVNQALANLGLGGGLTGVVGQSRNAVMNITAASATATWTADEIIVETAIGGTQYRLNGLNLSVNIATVGVGGMDTGAAPVSGYVALYVIYNPTSGAKALLATNATSSKVAEVYGGLNMPSGYTASALIAVLSTTSASVFYPAIVSDRSISVTQFTATSTSTLPSNLTALSISGIVPPNAKSVSGEIMVSTTSSGQTVSGGMSGSSYGGAIGNKGFSGITSIGIQYNDLRIATQQTIYWVGNVTGGTGSAIITITEYKI